ncbi:9518_t:CDS:2 [Funneliformis mosseae]|uniref:9518_t:CDS:1 n=1 Tax=Funneliformis mosseae TaxID=27381 RepID=A0A9N8ZHE0_FUNMO|nr:9518_t:CDS:2 [Funneliformis mosseae]
MRIKREWIDSSSGENLLPNLEYGNCLLFKLIVYALNTIKIACSTNFSGGMALDKARVQKTFPQVEKYFESKDIIDDKDEKSIIEEILNLSTLETEISGESFKKNREIEDDQMVAVCMRILLVNVQNRECIYSIISIGPVTKDLFESEFHCSDNMMSICQYHNEICPNGPLIDLRSKSNFTKQLPSNILAIYLNDLDDRIKSLIPSNIHNFLTKFFSQNLMGSDWNDKIDDLQWIKMII